MEGMDDDSNIIEKKENRNSCAEVRVESRKGMQQKYSMPFGRKITIIITITEQTKQQKQQ